MKIPDITITKGSYLDLVVHIMDMDGNARDLSNFNIKTLMHKHDSNIEYNLICNIVSVLDGIISLNTQTAQFEIGQYNYKIFLSILDENSTEDEKAYEGIIIVE